MDCEAHSLHTQRPQILRQSEDSNVKRAGICAGTAADKGALAHPHLPLYTHHTHREREREETETCSGGGGRSL
jgi:hypothetical protein